MGSIDLGPLTRDREYVRKIDPYLALAGVLGLIAVGGAVALLSSDGFGDVEVVDVQDKAAKATYNRGGPGVKGTLKRGRTRPGGASGVRAIMLHQVGVRNVGEAAWPKMSYHYGVSEDGRIFRIHPIETLLFHGHGLNDTTIAIAVGGNYGSGEKMPAKQARALRAAIALAKRETETRGGEIESIFAHRQTSSDRGNDPSKDPWRQGALWAQANLGVRLHPDFRHGTGRTIPDDWMT